MSEGQATLGARAAAFVIKGKRSFFKLSMREKALLLIFALALVGVWYSWLSDRLSSASDAIRAASVLSEEQATALDYLPGTKERYAQLISQIDIESLPSKDDVSSRVDALVRQAGFSSFDLGQARTEVGAGFNFHSVQLVVQKATYSQIRNFTSTLKRELPYVSMERIIIQAQARDDQFLDVRYVLKSIESTGNENF